MDKEILELQKLWKSENDSENQDVEKITEQLKTQEKKSRLTRQTILAALPVIIVYMFIVKPDPMSLNMQIGFALVVFAMCLFTFLVYKNHIWKNTSASTKNVTESIEFEIKKLKYVRTIATKYSWLYTIILMTGFDLFLFDALKSLGGQINWIAVIALSLILLIANLVVVKFNLKKYDRDVNPLVKQLEDLKK